MDKAIREQIEDLIQDIEQLPTLSTVYYNLQKILSDPNATAKEVGNAIEDDQALTSKILKLVNSAYFGFPKRISTITHSVIILGFKEIKNIALSVSIIDMFADKEETECLDRAEFWRHSLAVAICSNVIAKKVDVNKLEDAEVAFVAGLLHDIGKAILDLYLHRHYIDAIQNSKENKSLIIETEKETFGFTHQEIGQLLLEKWNLPSELISVVSLHNNPHKCSKFKKEYGLVSIVHVADIIVRAMNLGLGGDPYVPMIEKSCWEYLELSLNQIEIIIEEVNEIFNDIVDLLLPSKVEKE